MKVILQKESDTKGKLIRKNPLGYSLTILLFGVFVPFFRRDWKLFLIISGIKLSFLYLGFSVMISLAQILQSSETQNNSIIGWIMIISFLVIVPGTNLYFSFKYNRYSLISKLEAGFRPADVTESTLIKERYPEIAYRFRLTEEDPKSEKITKKNKSNKKILLIRDDTVKGREKKIIPVGISWTFLIFGPIVSIYREDWKSYFKIIGIVLAFDVIFNLLYQVGLDLTSLRLENGLGVALAIFYNQFSLTTKLKEGFKPVDLKGKNLIKIKYPNVSKKFGL